MNEMKFYLFLLAGSLYVGHNFTNFLLSGYDFILVITLVPYVIIGIVWGFWKRLHPYVIAPILLFLALVEIPVVPDNFYGFHVQSISGVFHLGSRLVLMIHAYLLIKGKVKTYRKINAEVKQ
ncbi:hypothetical protein P5G62_010805 [Neobacillus sp. 179-C4.2 HS]|uniref:Uncharacterized protein n=1 Tax=Neobacillus driksii TaxID=3035913 RepID=A0ABV4YSP9_9BACI|nr:hypothetical protein [Neobacillus sp. 179.-C4.2 HS]MDP5194285.1 hypothetical protein [Neobacillus sp. 179.-C4.2 HS]